MSTIPFDREAIKAEHESVCAWFAIHAGPEWISPFNEYDYSNMDEDDRHFEII